MARGQWSLFSFSHYVPDTVHGSCLAAGGCPCGLIRSVSPLSSHGSLHVSGILMAFKCLTHAHTILVGLVLRWKEDTGETPTRSGGSYWGAASSGAFGTHRGWPWPEFLSFFHSTCLLAEGPYEKGDARRWGKRPQGPPKCRPPKMSWSGRESEKNFQTWDRTRRKQSLLEWETLLEQWAS